MCDDCQVKCDPTEIPLPEIDGTPGSGADCKTEERRAYIYHRIAEEGHPSLVNNKKLQRIFDVSLRQTYYDIDCLMEYVENHVVARHHSGKNWTVFEKAKREALKEGNWEAAVQIVEKEAEWLENRGHIEKEPEKHEVSWRKFIESGE